MDDRAADGFGDGPDRNGGVRPGKREVDLYVRTYNTLLESSGAVSVASLEPAHLTASSSLHAGAEEPKPDLSAFLYSANRIPSSIFKVDHIVLGQSIRAFRRGGYPTIEHWESVKAPAWSEDDAVRW